MPEARARVLMTLADVAWPIDAGKRLRAASMVRAVAQHCDVDVVVLFADADPTVRPVPPDVDGDWLVVPPLVRSPARAATTLLRTQVPWQVAVQDWTKVRALLAERDGRYDLVWFGALDHFAELRRTVTAPTTVVDCDDVETEKLRAFLALARTAGTPHMERWQRRVERPLWGRIQRRAVRQADAVLVCSELDRTRLIEQAGGSEPTAAARIVSVPNTYPEPEDVSDREPQGAATLVVVANFGTDQNVDAAAFVAHDVLPLLRAAVPRLRVRLVGRRADRVAHLAGIDGLDVIGPVDSVADELAGAHAVLVPIRFGGGTRLKIVEALAYGRPIISTRAGAEGIDAVDGVHLLLADTPVEMAAAVTRLLTEPTLAADLVRAGRTLYERRYRPQATDAAVTAVLQQLHVLLD